MLYKIFCSEIICYSFSKIPHYLLLIQEISFQAIFRIKKFLNKRNEEKYDNKTNVYSYRIVLYMFFTGRLPKQSIRERLDKVPLKFPQVSSKISKYCINWIKKKKKAPLSKLMNVYHL